MVARDKFKVGQEVRLTTKGIKALQHFNTRGRRYDDKMRGYVCGFSRTPSCVMVQREDVAHGESYHMDYWEPVE